MTGHDEENLLREQGGILLEVDQGCCFRVGEDCLLHFKIRNLARRTGGRLRMRLLMDKVDLEKTVSCKLDQDITHVRFPFSTNRPGQKMVDALTLALDFPAERRSEYLVLPDCSVAVDVVSDLNASGQINLSGLEIDLEGHTGDVSLGSILGNMAGANVNVEGFSIRAGGAIGDLSVRDLIEMQDEKQPPAPAERWVAIRLSNEKDGRIVDHPPRKAGLRDLMLVECDKPQEEERRIFLFGRRELHFGLFPAVDDVEVPLVLRLLPCRSAARDPDHWNRNNSISRHHGSFVFKDHQVFLRDRSKYHTYLHPHPGGVLLRGEEAALPREFRMRLADRERGLELAGRLIYPRETVHGTELVGRQPDPACGDMDVGAEQPFPVDALSLTRMENTVQHRYVQVFRRATVGSWEGCAVPLAGEDVVSNHAAIVLYRGEWFVTCESSKGKTEVNDHRVQVREHLPLAPNKTVCFGKAKFRVMERDPRYMKNLVLGEAERKK